MTIFDFANFAGVFVFAATGALAASRRQLDIIGFIFLANVTGIGGGTMRDLVLGAPVFWVVEPFYLLAGTSAAIIVYFTAHLVESRYRLLLWFDAIGLSAYTVVGAAKGLALGFGPSVAIVTGILRQRLAAFCATWWQASHLCLCGARSMSAQLLPGHVFMWCWNAWGLIRFLQRLLPHSQPLSCAAVRFISAGIYRSIKPPRPHRGRTQARPDCPD